MAFEVAGYRRKFDLFSKRLFGVCTMKELDANDFYFMLEYSKEDYNSGYNFFSGYEWAEFDVNYFYFRDNFGRLSNARFFINRKFISDFADAIIWYQMLEFSGNLDADL